MKLSNFDVLLYNMNYGMISVYKIANSKSVRLNLWVKELDITKLINQPRKMKFK